jgi:endo-alpha-1,4-polygalactosaminidase (GH114 family)
MLHPKYWNSKQRDIAITQMKKIHSLGENGVNPAYLEQNTIDDDN